MNDIVWWFRGKYLICKLTCNQIINVYIKGTEVSEKGLKLYDYCAKVAFEDYQPQTYQEQMFEDRIKEDMQRYQQTERKHGAMILGGSLAQHIRPSVFWSDERPGKLITA